MSLFAWVVIILFVIAVIGRFVDDSRILPPSSKSPHDVNKKYLGSKSFKETSIHSRSDQGNNSGTSGSITTKVVGVTFSGRQGVVRKLHPGEILTLNKEPTNPHDPNAIKVLRKTGEQVGYINRELAKKISWWFDASWFTHYAEVIEIIGNEKRGQSLGVIIKISEPTLGDALATSEYKYPRFP